MAASSKEYRAIQHHCAMLDETLSRTVDPAQFAMKLQGKAMISRAIVQEASLLMRTPLERIRKVTDAVLAQINLNADLFGIYMEVLKEENSHLWAMLHRYYFQLNALEVLVSVSDWKQLGHHLSICEKKIHQLEEHGGVTERCREEVVQEWLKEDKAASWEQLCKALKSMGMEAEVQTIKKKYTSAQYSDACSAEGFNRPGLSSAKEGDTADQVQVFERRFADLVLRLQTELSRKRTPIAEFRHSVTLLPSTIRTEHIQFIKESIHDINNAGDVNSLFSHLNIYWTYLEYSLLSHIIQSHSSTLSAELKGEMKRYEEDIEVFKQRTTMEQLLQAGVGCVRREPPPNFTRIITKLKGKPSDYTLDYIDQFRRKMCMAYNLPTFILMLESADEGSLCIKWHIPSSELHFFGSTSQSDMELISAQLLCIEVDMSTMTSQCTGNTLMFSRIALTHKTDISGELVGVTMGEKKQTIKSKQQLPTAESLSHSIFEAIHSCSGDMKSKHQNLALECDPHSASDLTHMPPLYWACRYGLLEHARELMDKYKCSPKYTYEQGTTLLHLACTMGHVEVARYLATEHLLDPNAHNAKGVSVLSTACQNGHLDVMRFLIEELHCVVTSINPNESLLHTACAQGHLEVAQYLVEELGMDADAKLALLSQTPLLAACSNGRLEVARYLMESCGCSETACDNTGATALHVACLNNHREMAAYLLQRGQLDPSCRDKTGATPLHIACRYSHLKIVQLLLGTEGVDTSCTTYSGVLPLQEAHDKDIIRELIRSGARTKGVGLLLEQLATLRRPTEQGSLVRIFVVGHPSSGKSTLVKALKMAPRTFTGFHTQRLKVRDVDFQTAGIIPTEFNSPQFGRVLVFDFEGQYEYYGSHVTLLESTSEQVQPLFLIVVNLCKGEREVSRLVHYWTSFLESHRMSSASKPHLAVVGSHNDVLKKLNSSYKAEISIMEEFVQSEVSQSSFHFIGFFTLDCRSPNKQHQLRHHMQQSCRQLRSNFETDSICHVLGVFLLENFQVVCTVEEVLERARCSELPLPWKVDRMCELCEALCNHISILFFYNHTQPVKSWVVLDIKILLSSINGRIFAPVGFEEHYITSSSTGLLSYSVISKTFQDIDPSLIVAFLNRLEFCWLVSDPDTLELIHDGKSHASVSGSDSEDFNDCIHHPSLTSHLSFSSPDICSLMKQGNTEFSSSNTFTLLPAKPHLVNPNRRFSSAPSLLLSSSCETPPLYVPSDKFLFFPALIHTQRPSDSVWQLSGDFTYHVGWFLECLKDSLFFTPRFLQILLLRVTVGFAICKPVPLDSFIADSQVFQRECTLWKNGVRWVNLDGIEAVLEFLDGGRSILLLMRGKHRSKLRLTQLKAQVIRKILEAKKEFCPGISIQESLIDPASLCWPYDEVKRLLISQEAYCFDMALLARAIIDKQSYVLDRTGQHMEPLDSFTELEPYINLGEELLAELLVEGQEVIDFFVHFALCNEERAAFFAEVLGVHGSRNTCMDVLMQWWEKGEGVTLVDFRSKLDDFSLFSGRNILGFRSEKRTDTNLQWNL